ncbi:hypothetical protein [Pendulispora albinea]|uniref:Uncharacterized protein n=1 Tax=Pendulispora albinea TaxID=2741071 RepID=A0ABZ2M3K0_9BACT
MDADGVGGRLLDGVDALFMLVGADGNPGLRAADAVPRGFVDGTSGG